MVKYTDEQLLKLDPELDALFQKHGVPQLAVPTRETVPTFRKFFNKAAQRYNNSPLARAALGNAFDKPDWTECDHEVGVQDGRNIKVRAYQPKAAPTGGAAVFVMIHGGGWFMGDLDTEALWCRVLASKLSIVAVSVDYGLYPEVAFGVPTLDCFDAVKWVAANASSFGGNLRKGFIVGGNSGGSTYASIACHLAANEGLHPPLTGCYLACPILTDEIVDEEGNASSRYDHNTEFRSWNQNANAPLMGEQMRLSIRDLMNTDFKENSKLLTPFNFENQKCMPSTYIQVCGLDPWRDAGFIMQQELIKENVETKIDVYPGLPHCWWTTFPQLKATGKWLGDCVEGVRWLLREGDREATPKL